MQDEKLAELVYKFFEAFNCSVEWKGKLLIVENVPKDFEKFFGKNSPYIFSFDPQINEGELITKSSFLIRIINDYLGDKAQTTLLRIEFDKDLAEEITKNYTLQNCKVNHISKEEQINFMTRFTFLTTIQYLNEKEQITTPIYLSGNNIIDFDESKFQLIDGRERDVKKIENLDSQVESSYEIAKSTVKDLLKPNIDKITFSLKEKLSQEIARIDNHSNQQLSEINLEIEKANKRIEQYKKEYDKKRDETIPDKIKKLEEKIIDIKNKTDFKQLNEEKELLIKNEIRNHALSIKNKIINTSIIYYPAYKLNVFFKTSKSARLMNIDYDPFHNTFSKLNCEVCNKEVNEIILCNSSHLTCRECGEYCDYCKEIVCKRCTKNTCSDCGKNICNSCNVRCNKCGKNYCNIHIPKTTGKTCKNCSITCEGCFKMFTKDMISKSNGKNMCGNCRSKTVSQNILNRIRE